MADHSGEAFLRHSVRHLVDDYMPRLLLCVERLEPTDLWWRPNDVTNSVGNLLQHLRGNLDQWVISGVGGAADERRRSEEFAEPRGAVRPTGEALMEALASVVGEAETVLTELDPQRLSDPVRIQGRSTSVLGAIYHAVEHFAMHTGQIILLTKIRTGRDLGFFAVEDDVPRPTW